MKIATPKLKAMLKYFCEYTDPVYLGKTKLMKLFYFADFLHVKRHGHPITFDRYIHLEHGPVPSKILNLVNSVADDPEHAVLSDTISVKRAEGMNIQKVECSKKFSEGDKNFFSNQELDILDEVCKKFGDKNTKFIEDASHKESAWLLTDEVEEIPYSLAAQDADSEVDEEEIKLLMKII